MCILVLSDKFQHNVLAEEIIEKHGNSYNIVPDRNYHYYYYREYVIVDSFVSAVLTCVREIWTTRAKSNESSRLGVSYIVNVVHHNVFAVYSSTWVLDTSRSGQLFTITRFERRSRRTTIAKNNNKEYYTHTHTHKRKMKRIIYFIIYCSHCRAHCSCCRVGLVYFVHNVYMYVWHTSFYHHYTLLCIPI